MELRKRGLTKIEFCDLYGRDKEIVNIKRYTGSSELSHLFQQGVVSGELFAREQGNKPLPEVIAAKPSARFDAEWGNLFQNPRNFIALVYQGV